MRNDLKTLNTVRPIKNSQSLQSHYFLVDIMITFPVFLCFENCAAVCGVCYFAVKQGCMFKHLTYIVRDLIHEI